MEYEAASITKRREQMKKGKVFRSGPKNKVK